MARETFFGDGSLDEQKAWEKALRGETGEWPEAAPELARLQREIAELKRMMMERQERIGQLIKQMNAETV